MRVHSHIRHNIVGYVALFVAVSGGAYAAGTGIAPRNSVVSSSIKNGQVKSADLKNNGVRGVDVDEASLGKVPSALEADVATDVELFGEIGPGQLQRRVTGACTGGAAIAAIDEDGSVDCASKVIPFAPSTAGGGRPVPLGPSDLELGLTCGVSGKTEVAFVNKGGPATLNWILSKGGAASTVDASGGALAQAGSVLSFDFDDARIEGQFVYATADEVTSVNLHAFDGNSFCELRGTAQYATK